MNVGQDEIKRVIITSNMNYPNIKPISRNKPNMNKYYVVNTLFL